MVVDMSNIENSNVEIALRYHRAVSDFASGEELAAFFHPDFTHHELPNALFPLGNVRSLDQVRAASAAGRKGLSEQNFEVLNAIAMGEQVALEVLWTGTLAVPVRDLPVGHVLRAHIATVLEFRAGKIIAQRNYDCYEPLVPA